MQDKKLELKYKIFNKNLKRNIKNDDKKKLNELEYKTFNSKKKLEKKLNELELKYGGIQRNIKRNIKSAYEKKYYTEHRGGDRMNSEYHNYSKIYSAYLLKFLNKKINLVEIGILNGIGLAIWCDIFKDSNIYGFDIDIDIFKNNFNNLQKKNAFEFNKPNIFTFDQFLDNCEYLKNIIKNHTIDVVIDDGCHQNQPILTTFKSFIPYLSDDFIYFIEDNNEIYKTIKKLYPKFKVFYKNRMTVITPN